MHSVEERAVYWTSRLMGLEAPSDAVKDLAAYKYMLEALLELKAHMEMLEFERMVDEAGLLEMGDEDV